MFAKDRIAASRLWEQRKHGVFRKEYLELVEGKYPQENFSVTQTIDVPIGPVSSEKNKMCVIFSGKRAVRAALCLENCTAAAIYRGRDRDKETYEITETRRKSEKGFRRLFDAQARIWRLAADAACGPRGRIGGKSRLLLDQVQAGKADICKKK